MYTPQEIERYTKMLIREGVPEEVIAYILDIVYTIASVAIESKVLDNYEKEQEIEKEYRKAS